MPLTSSPEVPGQRTRYSGGPAVAALTADDVRTSVDARLELFDADQFALQRTVEAASPGWQDTLVDWCPTDVVAPADSPLTRGLLTDRSWEVVVLDSGYETSNAPRWFVRSDADGPCQT